jgi:23S rRNA (guanine745-N1)-methyltransferase
MTARLLCTVRDCRLPLARDGARLACERGHSFDVARSGYANLLQPQDSRSREPGDSREAVAARTRIHRRGVAEPLLRAIEALLRPSAGDAILDAGCGDGWFLGELQRAAGFEGHGIDISTAAVAMAARHYPACHWIVGNADRFVPYADGSFSKLMSITARMNAPEFRRVLRDDGVLLVAVPALDDLIELRGTGRDRVARTIETFEGPFAVIGHRRADTVVDADEELIDDLRLSIYRPRGGKVSRVTLSLDLILFKAAS